jgi:hypothetical protein
MDHWRGGRRANPTLVALPEALHPILQVHGPFASSEGFLKGVEFLRPVKGGDIELAKRISSTEDPNRPTGSLEYRVEGDGKADWEVIRSKIGTRIVHRRLPELK